MKKLTLQVLLAITLFSSCLSSCSPDDEVKKEPEIEKSNNIEASTTNVAPLEVVQLYSKNPLTQDSYSAKLMGAEITLGKFNDTTLVFIVPQTVANKEGNLTFLVQGKQEEINFKVSALELVNNPTEEIQRYIQEMIEDIGENSGNPVLDEYYNVIQENISAFNSTYSTLSNEDKIMVASILSINFPAVNPNRMASTQSSDCISGNQAMVNKYYFDVKISAIIMYSSLLITEPLISKAVAIVSSVKFVTSVYKMTEASDDLARCPALGVIHSFNNYVRTEGEIYNFNNRKEYLIKFFGKYEGINKHDLSSSNSVRKSFATHLDLLSSKLTEFKKQYNKVVEFLGLNSLSLDALGLLPNNPLISEIKEIHNNKITTVGITTEKAIVKKNALEGSDYILSLSNKTIEKQSFDIFIEGQDEGISAKGTFHAELQASQGKIVVQDGTEKTADENNEATVVLTVLNEEETPVENGIIEISSTSSDISFPSGNSFTTGSNGLVTFKVKISEESTNSSFNVLVKLKNMAGEILNEVSVNIINSNPIIGVWKAQTYAGKPLGTPIVYYMDQCPQIPEGEETMFGVTFTFNVETYTYVFDEASREYMYEVSDCVITKDNPDNVLPRVLDEYNGTYTSNNNTLTLKDDEDGQVMILNVVFVNENKTKFYFAADPHQDIYVKQ